MLQKSHYIPNRSGVTQLWKNVMYPFNNNHLKGISPVIQQVLPMFLTFFFRMSFFFKHYNFYKYVNYQKKTQFVLKKNDFILDLKEKKQWSRYYTYTYSKYFDKDYNFSLKLKTNKIPYVINNLKHKDEYFISAKIYSTSNNFLFILQHCSNKVLCYFFLKLMVKITPTLY